MAGSEELRILDLFSGIGGFSLALGTVGRTVAYCDVAREAREVLLGNMDRGVLERAPIFEDVCDIGKKIDITHLKPNMITAGFPCTDISAANPRGEGLDGLRSGLFKEVLRICDRYPEIGCVFLENSPRIKFKGLDYVVRSMRRRGFRVRYTFMGALDVGAFHKRARWYCLCVRGGFEEVVKRCVIEKKLVVNKGWARGWRFDEDLVIKFRDKKERDVLRARCGLLGNAVVPFCARYAWNCLVGQEEMYREHEGVLRHTGLDLEFGDGKRRVRREWWATPVHSMWYQYASLTDRGVGLLCNQAFYHVSSHKLHRLRGGAFREYTVNPHFVEYLMGYPKNWTRAAGINKSQSIDRE